MRHEVAFVLIGGVAERLWGSPRATDDVDICPAADRRNLRRLAGALNELEAVFRPAGREAAYPPPEPWNEASFRRFTSLALVTPHGWLDVWFRPDGRNGYDELMAHASTVTIGATTLRLASLDDIIRSKEAAGGTRYLTHLPLLRELREQRLRRDDRNVRSPE